MFPDRPKQLDAALLYKDYKPFAYRQLVTRLQKIFGEKVRVKLGVHEDGSFGIINVEGIILKISQNSHALGIEGFAATLMAPFTTHTKPDAQKTIQSHRKNIFVTVGCDPILIPDFAPGEVSPEVEKLLAKTRPIAAKPSAAVHANRVFVARTVINELIAMNKPSLIHWLQSDQLVTPEEMSMANDSTGMALQLHPVMFSTGNDEDGKQMIGFDAFGAEHIMGYHVVVEETQLLFETVFKDVQGFIYALHNSGAEPVSGKVMTLKSGASFKVHCEPANDKYKRPYLRLEVLKTGTPKTPSSRPKTPAQRASGLKTALGFATSFLQRNKSLSIAVVLALILGQLLGGETGMQTASLLGF
jgi:hypothetical protein